MAPSDTPRDPESMIGVPSPLLDIQSRTFATARRGYDRAEVDAFLKRLAETISGLLEERTVLSADAAAALDPETVAESTAILEDAEARASRRLHAATLEADRLRTEARRTLDKAIKEAQEVENAARANAEQLTAEATEMRQQILRDLLRRRKEAQMHVEMLRAARDELMNVFDQVRRITAQVKDPLDSALDRAKQAADIAAKRTQEEPQESLTQFEAELQTARLSGVIPIPVEADREAVVEEAAPAEEVVAEAAVEGVALTDAGLADEAAASMEPSGSFAEDARHQPAASEPAISEPLASGPSVEPAPAAEAAEEPGAAVVAEPAERDDGWHDGEVQLEHDEPELENIFARLRESASRPEEQTAREAESADEAEAESQSEPPKKSSKKKAASKKTAKKKASKKPARKTASEMQDDADSEAATSDAELASAADIPPADIPDAAPPVSEVQASDVQISDPPVSDAEIEDLKRRIKRALTTDESRVLQAVHRLHKKAPKKAEELKKALTDQDTRTEEFAQALPASAHDIQSLLVSPLAASLSACDIEEADTKALVQQVRDVYRAFSQERIAPVAAELAEHALEN